jgi:hypothetical protein
MSNQTQPHDVVGVNRWLKMWDECGKGEWYDNESKILFLVVYSPIFSISDLNKGSLYVLFKYGILNS